MCMMCGCSFLWECALAHGPYFWMLEEDLCCQLTFILFLRRDLSCYHCTVYYSLTILEASRRFSYTHLTSSQCPDCAWVLGSKSRFPGVLHKCFFSCWAVFLTLYHDSQLSNWNNMSLLSWYTHRPNSNFEMHLMQLHALFFIYAFYSWRTFELHPVTGSWLLCSGHHCKHFLNWPGHFPLCVSERKSSRQACAWASSCCPVFPDESCLRSDLLCSLTSAP